MPCGIIDAVTKTVICALKEWQGQLCVLLRGPQVLKMMDCVESRRKRPVMELIAVTIASIGAAGRQTNYTLQCLPDAHPQLTTHHILMSLRYTIID